MNEQAWRKFNLPSRAHTGNSKVIDPIQPEFELIQDSMPVLVTSKFDKDPIKNEPASLETPNIWEIFRRSRAPNSVGSSPTWPKFELTRDFLPVLVTCLKVWKRSDKKQQRKGGDIVFPIIRQWALSVAMETRVFVQSAPKTYAAFPPTPVMPYIKFDQDWMTSLRDIQVQKCGQWRQ